MHYFIPLQETLAPEILDAALAQGYYRMRQNLFTTDTTYTDDGSEVTVLWARVLLGDYVPNRRHQKLARLCRRFNCSLQGAEITPEIEDLYNCYRAHIDFDAGPTVASCMLDGHGENFFPGKMWTMRDGERLIAAGYFDEGRESAAGILNFYHPDYRKYSPGLFLYLESIRHTAKSGRRFFYPGYIALDYTKFDYKLLPGPERIEIWDTDTARWLPYAGSIHEQQTQRIRKPII